MYERDCIFDSKRFYEIIIMEDEKKHNKQRKISEIEQSLNLTHPTLNKWQTGTTTTISLPILMQICNYYGLSLDYAVGVCDNPLPKEKPIKTADVLTAYEILLKTGEITLMPTGSLVINRPEMVKELFAAIVSNDTHKVNAVYEKYKDTPTFYNSFRMNMEAKGVFEQLGKLGKKVHHAILTSNCKDFNL